MVALQRLTDREKYLLAILTSPNGIDLAEFSFADSRRPQGRYRLYDYQWAWWACQDMYQIDQCGRSLGKSESVKLRAAAMPFHYRGRGMLITAPELNHLRPLTDPIEEMLLNTRLIREMLPAHKSAGMNRQPHWQCRFKNGTYIVSRLPGVTGKGVKGCIDGSALITTRRGMIPVAEIQVGDLVLTHKNRWRPVDAVYRFENPAQTYAVSGGGVRELIVSDMHAFYGRRNRSGPKGARDLAEPGWVDVVDPELSQRWYLGSPTEFPSSDVPAFFDDPAICWLAGAYVADGYIARRTPGGAPNRVAITDSPGGVARSAEWVTKAGYHYGVINRSNGSDRLEVSSVELAGEFLANFGEHSHAKHLPIWLLGAPRRLRQAFLDGYLAGDGTWVTDRGRAEASTASRELAVGLRILGQTLGYTCGLSWVDPKVKEICEVTLKGAPLRSYRVQFRTRGVSLVEGGVQWSKVRGVQPKQVDVVYDLTVRDDHSYVADSIICHNQHVHVLEQDECFPSGTLVLLKRGLVPIEEVAVGDMALTHRNRWRRVTDVMVRPDRKTVTVRGYGHPGLRCSENHRFLSVTRNAALMKEGNGLRQSKQFTMPDFKEAKDLGDGSYWATPKTYPSVSSKQIPSLVGHAYRADLNPPCVDVSDPRLYWVVGLYLAEGWIGRSHEESPLNRISFSIDDDEVEEVKKRLALVGLEPSGPYLANKARRGVNLVLYGNEYHDFAAWLIRHFGRLSGGMTIPAWALGMPEECRRQLFDGLLYGDGYHREVGRDGYSSESWKLTTISRSLAVGARMLGVSLGFSVPMYWSNTSSYHKEIDGRPIGGDGFYQVIFRPEESGQSLSYDHKQFSPVREITENSDPEVLYDLTIEEDSSFIAEGFIVHNCQDYSRQGNIELVETLNAGDEGAIWRCVAEGQLILSENGWIPIEEIRVGERVWTHRQRWRRVERIFDNGYSQCVSIGGQGHFGLEVTSDHKFWLAQVDHVKNKESRTRRLRSPAWQEFGSEKAYWASPRGISSQFPPPVMDDPHFGTSKSIDVTHPDWLWLYGHYIAQGYTCRVNHTIGAGFSSRAHWCSNRRMCDEISKRLLDLGIANHRYEKGESVKVITTRREVADWLSENSGVGALNKKLAMWVFGLDFDQRHAVFDGMLSGDGWWSDKRNRWEYVTASRQLAVGLKILAQSFGYVANMQVRPERPSRIEGRLVHTSVSYTVQITPSPKKSHSIFDETHVWSPVQPADIKPAGIRRVFDLEVAEDHSYVVEGIVVSNCHGVSKGIRTEAFFQRSQPGSGWTVHRIMAMMRPTWNDVERQSKILEYGGTRQAVDYKRNIYGEHGDESSAVFVLSRLAACISMDDGNKYNSEVYSSTSFVFEKFPDGASDAERSLILRQAIYIPVEHLDGYSEKVAGREVGSPKGYSAYWGGMDVGVTNHPSEILVFGQRTGSDFLELLLRVNLQRIDTDSQKEVVRYLFETYGEKFQIGIDRNGVGFPIWDQLSRESFGDRVHGFHETELRPAAIEERELKPNEKPEDLVIKRATVESATDWLRNNHVDARALRLPNDGGLISQFQGQTAVTIRDTGSPYGVKRLFSGGGLHALDAAKYAIAAKYIPALEKLLAEKPKARRPVIDVFMGMG